MVTLEVGTKLVEWLGFHGTFVPATVVRLTPTQAVTDRGSKYRRKDGVRVGAYGTATLWTDEHDRRCRRGRLEREVAKAIRAFKAVGATDDALHALLAALTPVPPTQPEE